MNFSVELQKHKARARDKVDEIRVQRNLFGRLLALSLDMNIDLEKVLSYPITLIPMSLCHADGSIYKTPKSTLISLLET